MSRARFRDDNRFYKDRLPPNIAPDWACKPNDGAQETAPNRSQTPPARPVCTGSTTLNRPINPPVQSASTGSASTESTTLNRPTTSSPVRPAPVRTAAPVRNVRYRPTRDYDDWINYNAEYEHQYGESSTTGMIRGAIQEADGRNQSDNNLPDDLFPYYDDSDNEFFKM